MIMIVIMIIHGGMMDTLPIRYVGLELGKSYIRSREGSCSYPALSFFFFFFFLFFFFFSCVLGLFV